MELDPLAQLEGRGLIVWGDVVRLGQAGRELLAWHVLDHRVVQGVIEVVGGDLGRVLLGI